LFNYMIFEKRNKEKENINKEDGVSDEEEI
jgi:hypothetical protein